MKFKLVLIIFLFFTTETYAASWGRGWFRRSRTKTVPRVVVPRPLIPEPKPEPEPENVPIPINTNKLPQQFFI